MRKYRPKKASKRWLIDAPDYILSVYDNGGKTCDRYTVLFAGHLWNASLGYNVMYLAMSDGLEFSQWGEMRSDDREACGKQIAWLDLPEHIRNHVIDRAKPEI
jgi:hypothetical protein